MTPETFPIYSLLINDKIIMKKYFAYIILASLCSKPVFAEPSIGESGIAMMSYLENNPKVAADVISKLDVQSYGKCMTLISLVQASEIHDTKFSTQIKSIYGGLYGAMGFYRKIRISEGYSPAYFDDLLKPYGNQALANGPLYYKKYAQNCVDISFSRLLKYLPPCPRRQPLKRSR
jgi:hypothetical protein